MQMAGTVGVTKFKEKKMNNKKQESKPKTKKKELFFTKKNYFEIKQSIFEKNLQENDFLINFFK